MNNTRLVGGDAAEAVAGLKREDGKDLYVFGCAKLWDGGGKEPMS